MLSDHDSLPRFIPRLPLQWTVSQSVVTVEWRVQFVSLDRTLLKAESFVNAPQSPVSMEFSMCVWLCARKLLDCEACKDKDVIMSRECAR